MHLHGHNMYVLNEGIGSWDGSVVNSGNPQRRDVQLMQPDGYIAIQYDSVNPGVWPFHCHIAWHVSGGLYINLMVSVFRPPILNARRRKAGASESTIKWLTRVTGTTGRYRGDAFTSVEQADLRRLGGFHQCRCCRRD